jgi:homoserine dehydrogenase
MTSIAIGLVGAGTIGGGVVKMMHSNEESLGKNFGLPVTLKRIVDRDVSRFGNLPTGNAICSDSVSDLLSDKEIQVVIELVGGTTFAKELITDALAKGKHIITANKALIAEHGPAIFELAEKKGLSVGFEASVGGGMPVIKAIRESLAADRISSVKTIINGTSNYILTQMSEKGLLFETALKKAQKNGYAEADPILDIGGGDSGHKVAIMASLIHGGYVPFHKMSIEGITDITKDDIEFAKDLGYCIKLLGIIRKDENDPAIDVRVHPAMLHKNHILSSVSDAFNAVLLEGEAVGPILLYGKGAGEMPTASAVMSDIIDIARSITGGAQNRIPMQYYRLDNELTVKPIDSLLTRYYLCFWVIDKPKVLAAIASVLGDYQISIASVMQKEGGSENCVPVIILTHKALERNIRAALAEIEKMEFIKKKTHVIRIAGQTY